METNGANASSGNGAQLAAQQSGALQAPGAQQPGAQPIPIDKGTEIYTKLMDVINKTTFVIEKKLSTVAQAGASVESAYLAEDETKKEPYNLIIKIDTNSGDLGKKIQDDIRIGKNYKFKLVPQINYGNTPNNNNETKLYYIPIQYSYEVILPDDNITQSKETVYIYCITNVKINGITDKTIPQIFMIEAKLEKTGTLEYFKSWAPLTAKYTARVSQALPELEKEILDLLKELIPQHTNENGTPDPFEKKLKDKTNELSTQWKIGVPVFLSLSTNLQGRVKILINTVLNSSLINTSAIPEDTTNFQEDPLIKKITDYNKALSKDEQPFRLKMKRTSGPFSIPRYESEYDNQYGFYHNRELFIYHLVNLYMDLKNEINKHYDTVINELFTGTTKPKIEDFNRYMAYFMLLYKTIAGMTKTEEASRFLARVANIASWGKSSGGGSIKYQQKRYKVHERDDGARYITLDKKNYTLKMSSKGTYITRDGKRQYL